jgi:predicted transglutaminase-like cysteine proteinase
MKYFFLVGGALLFIALASIQLWEYYEKQNTLKCITNVNNNVNSFKYVFEEPEPSLFDPNFMIKDLEVFEQGDCEDFAYTKYKRILESCFVQDVKMIAFYPKANTLPVPEGIGHAVTYVKTNKGEEFILDNNAPFMYPFSELKRIVKEAAVFVEDKTLKQMNRFKIVETYTAALNE